MFGAPTSRREFVRNNWPIAGPERPAVSSFSDPKGAQALATTVPLILGMFIAKYIFRFHDALILGIISGSRTTTASLGLVCDMGKSQVPALGYTVTYAVGNTFLTIWGMVLIVLLAK